MSIEYYFGQVPRGAPQAVVCAEMTRHLESKFLSAKKAYHAPRTLELLQNLVDALEDYGLYSTEKYPCTPLDEAVAHLELLKGK